MSLAAFVMYSLINFPVGRVWIGTGLAGYVILLFKFPPIWAFVVPFLLPLLDLAPLSGRIFLDEYDLFILITIVPHLWGGNYWINPIQFIKNPDNVGKIVGLVVVSYIISTGIGLYPLQDITLNAFSNYYSHYNSLRIAKGFCWAILLLPLIRQLNPREVVNLVIPGMVAGLSGLGVIVLIERALFPGLLNFSSDYRITGTFFTMNTGGGHIEAYLAAAIPFIGAWGIIFNKSKTVLAASLLLFAVTVYAMATTFARGGYLAMVVLMAVFTGGYFLRLAKGSNLRVISRTVFGLMWLTMALIIIGTISFSSSFMQRRMESSGLDLQTRLNHWQAALALRDRSPGVSLFGMGIGAFPRMYYLLNKNNSTPVTYEIANSATTSFLKLRYGEPSYIGQRLKLEPGKTYRLSVSFRGDTPKSRLTVPICEWSLLRSYNCEWLVFPGSSEAGEWQTATLAFQRQTTGIKPHRPMQLALYNSVGNTLLKINRVSLLDDRNNELLKNGDFSNGMDHWFFSTESHLPWHIKQFWLAILFEQGWFGVLAVAVLTLFTLVRLSKQVRWEPYPVSLTFLTSIAGFLTVGLFGSQFDAPRLAFLYYLIVFLSLTVETGKAKHERPL